MKKIIFILLILLCIPISVQAQSAEPKKVPDENTQIERLYEYIYNMKTEYELLKDMNIKDYVSSYIKSGSGGFSLIKARKALINYILKETAASMRLMIIIIAISIICSLLNNLERAFNNESLINIAYFACLSIIIIFMSKSFYIGVGLAKDTISKMTDFMTALMPVLMTLIASMGGISEAIVLDPIIIGTINLSSRIYIDFIIPLVFMTFVLQFVSSISSEYKIDKLIKLLNQAALWTQGIMMTIFIGIITVRGITSKTLDQVTAKTAKYAVDNFIPIVGKCLSDAVSTVAGYSLLLKNAISSLGLIVVIVIMLLPVIKIFIIAITYKLVAALIQPVSDGRLVNCIGSAGDSLILVMSCLISVSVMFFIMIAITATAGKALLGG